MKCSSLEIGLTPSRWLKHYLWEQRVQILLWVVAVAASFTHAFFTIESLHDIEASVLGSGVVLLGGSYAILQMLQGVYVGVVVEPLPKGRFERRWSAVMTAMAVTGATLVGLGVAFLITPQ